MSDNPTYEQLEAISEGYEDALITILDWARAYPEDMFPDQDLKRADAILNANGISMSAMHGQWGRRIAKGMGNTAEKALRSGSTRGIQYVSRRNAE